MPDMVSKLFGGGNANDLAEKQAKRQNLISLAETARQKAEADQAMATGGKRQAGSLLNFAGRRLSGDGNTSLG